MGRRLYAAFDLGLRHGEIVKIQLKHVDFKPIEVNVDDQVRQVLVIALPPSVTKDGKATGETEYVYAGTDRLKQELEKRRFALKRNAEAYVFGTEAWEAREEFQADVAGTFELAGLTFGRKLGLTWPSAPSSSPGTSKTRAIRSSRSSWRVTRTTEQLKATCTLATLECWRPSSGSSGELMPRGVLRLPFDEAPAARGESHARGGCSVIAVSPRPLPGPTACPARFYPGSDPQGRPPRYARRS
jgi:hypothetical protein